MNETTLYLIAYDIPNDRRRTKVHQILCGFGQWTQFSLFECFLTAKERVALHGRILEVINQQEDNVRIYPLCQSCRNKVETMGSSPPAEDSVYLL